MTRGSSDFASSSNALADFGAAGFAGAGRCFAAPAAGEVPGAGAGDGVAGVGWRCQFRQIVCRRGLLTGDDLGEDRFRVRSGCGSRFSRLPSGAIADAIKILQVGVGRSTAVLALLLHAASRAFASSATLARAAFLDVAALGLALDQGPSARSSCGRGRLLPAG